MHITTITLAHGCSFGLFTFLPVYVCVCARACVCMCVCVWLMAVQSYSFVTYIKLTLQGCMVNQVKQYQHRYHDTLTRNHNSANNNTRSGFVFDFTLDVWCSAHRIKAVSTMARWERRGPTSSAKWSEEWWKILNVKTSFQVLQQMAWNWIRWGAGCRVWKSD